MESARPQQTVEQLLARLEQVAAKSSRRKSALKSLMKAYDIQVYMNRDYVDRLSLLTNQNNTCFDDIKRISRRNSELEASLKLKRWWMF